MAKVKLGLDQLDVAVEEAGMVVPLAEADRVAVAFIEEINLNSRKQQIEDAYNHRISLFDDRYEYLQALEDRKAEIIKIDSNPVIAKERRELRELQALLYPEETLVGKHGQKIAQIPPSGAMSAEYNELVADFKRNRQVMYDDKVLPFDNLIANLKPAYDECEALIKQEQKEYDAGKASKS